MQNFPAVKIQQPINDMPDYQAHLWLGKFLAILYLVKSFELTKLAQDVKVLTVFKITLEAKNVRVHVARIFEQVMLNF